ncbi:MAG: HepT-like ribonuclease domain-containing protein [Candidatus Aminicenantales bacterium]
MAVSELRLGLPSEEVDLFRKTGGSSGDFSWFEEILKKMKGFRNRLVPQYGHVEDEIVYDTMKSRLSVFSDFKKEIIKVLA